jgi:hypothetical protein
LRSRTKTSATPFVSWRTRLVARDANTTYRPSAEIAAVVTSLRPCPWTSRPFTDTLRVTSRLRSRTKTSATAFVSWPTRLAASDTNTTYRPVAETEASVLAPAPCASPLLTDTRTVALLRAPSDAVAGPADAEPATIASADSAARELNRRLLPTIVKTPPS